VSPQSVEMVGRWYNLVKGATFVFHAIQMPKRWNIPVTRCKLVKDALMQIMTVKKRMQLSVLFLLLGRCG
jgi:hypothetical protein